MKFENPQHALFTSLQLLAELEDVIFRIKFEQPIAQAQTTARQLFDGFVALAHTVKVNLWKSL